MSCSYSLSLYPSAFPRAKLPRIGTIDCHQILSSLVTDTSAFEQCPILLNTRLLHGLLIRMSTTDIPTEPNDDGALFVQRYALAVLYYALGGPDWVFDARFFNKDDTCEWLQRFTTQDGQFDMGVQCNNVNHVKELRLRTYTVRVCTCI